MLNGVVILTHVILMLKYPFNSLIILIILQTQIEHALQCKSKHFKNVLHGSFFTYLLFHFEQKPKFLEFESFWIYLVQIESDIKE